MLPARAESGQGLDALFDSEEALSEMSQPPPSSDSEEDDSGSSFRPSPDKMDNPYDKKSMVLKRTRQSGASNTVGAAPVKVEKFGGASHPPSS